MKRRSCCTPVIQNLCSLCSSFKLYSIVLQIYLLSLRLWPGLSFYGETRLRLSLLLYGQSIFLYIYPFLDPKQTLSYHFLRRPKKSYPRTILVHIFLVDGLKSASRYLFVEYPIQSFHYPLNQKLSHCHLLKYPSLLPSPNDFYYARSPYASRHQSSGFFQFINQQLVLYPTLYWICALR